MKTGRISEYLCTIIFPHSEENILTYKKLKSYFEIAQMRPKSAGSFHNSRHRLHSCFHG